MKSNTTERFTDRVENYVKYRPGYPTELIEFLSTEIGLNPEWTIADIGCGTGISSKMFLENGNRVFGVEPNESMRNASITHLRAYPQFTAVSGTAYETALADSSIDLVFAAQSFHWFCNAVAVSEFRRILRPGRHVALVWNEREMEIDNFHIELEALLCRFAVDYDQVRHDNFTQTVLEEVFKTNLRQETFYYQQLLDLKGFKGRIHSSSYMPPEGSEEFDQMINEIEALFAVHAEMGKISVLYNTKLFYCSI